MLLLDEPAAGVPSAESHIILDAIDALPKSIGVLIIDHDMDLVFRFAKKITVLVRGAVFAEGTPKEIGANPDVRAVYLGQADAWLARVELKGVSAGYGETVVLEDINLALAPGESISVIGRNGVGKTTLLSTIMGHTTLHKGEVLLAGKSLNRVPVYRRAAAGIGFVPQEREIFPSLSVLENLEVGARPGHWTKERVFELFPNLKERLDNRGNQLSGGEQQMLSIARALLTNPSVLLMDEPTEGLAPVIVEALTAVLIKLRSESGLSIILVEQNSRVAFEFSDRSVVLDKGRIVYDGALGGAARRSRAAGEDHRGGGVTHAYRPPPLPPTRGARRASGMARQWLTRKAIHPSPCASSSAFRPAGRTTSSAASSRNGCRKSSASRSTSRTRAASPATSRPPRSCARRPTDTPSCWSGRRTRSAARSIPISASTSCATSCRSPASPASRW